MGSNFRAGKVVMDAVSTTDGGVTSDPAYVGTAHYVGLMLENAHATHVATITAEVNAPPDRSPGINLTDDSTWYQLYTDQGDGTLAAWTVDVPADSNVGIELPLFCFQAIRLIAASTSSGNAATVTATVAYVR